MKEKICGFVLLLTIIGLQSAKADIEDRLKEDFFKIYKHTAIEAKEITNEHVTPDKIKYFLFTKNHPENYTEIDPSSPEELAEAKVPIVFIIHGWTENREREWYEDLKNAFLTRREDYYVVQVDWSDPADQIYTISSWNTKDVGHIIGEFIVGLHKNYSVPLGNILLVGHSLGGQVSGFVGKKVQELTGNKLPRIIALDPAGPLFISRPDEERLNKNDAEVVHVIHTDGGTFGFKSSCGTIDFFPNGGSSQPGCTRIDLLDIKSVAEPITCDHHRSWQFFIEAVLNPNEFLATRCESYTKFKTGLCEKDEVPMGDLETKKTGDFYLETNKEKPFAKRRRGLGVGSVLSSLKVF
ncbi:Vitellogenin-2-like Protein [Tribolium castaneum]|uniref:Vitellogenin-2-like Protein n=3 Tax=Tribolium castaneum TaxID=7070 RepID=D6WU99_TRICA|nr:PREDICTED: phospholipase A1 2 [Tribolium castaneum]EFA06789.1 Vitellogenin-2-like Protein [Tribolium castaneum]|eukprot:XP_008195538.1 PREDICTED: phospholipase A1 2 [Tribolium castaneum]